MMKSLSKRIFILFLIFSLSGCAFRSSSREDLKQESSKFRQVIIKKSGFQIVTYQKITNESMPYVFYIDQDDIPLGRIFKLSYDILPDPRILLKLARADDRPNIVYIASPCQDISLKLNSKCDARYRTHKRFSEETVDAINQVINAVNVDGEKFSLIGYSGGGAIAVLVAASNPLVKNIITIAANLDHRVFTRHHDLSPMIESLNPIDYASEVADIPQLHLSGGRDYEVTPFMIDEFIMASDSGCVKQKIFPDNTHNKGWTTVWKKVLKIPLVCRN